MNSRAGGPTGGEKAGLCLVSVSSAYEEDLMGIRRTNRVALRLSIDAAKTGFD